MQYIPLSPADNIVYEAWGHTDDERFVAVFQKTWQQIPEKYRRELVEFWQRKSVEQGEAKPRIVVWKSHLHRLRDGYPYALGQCEQEGTEIYFRSSWIDVMPDDMLGVLIAHELGHAYLAAVNGSEYWFDTPYSLHEDDVAELLGWWDFDENALDQWIDDHRQEFHCSCGSVVEVPLGSWEWCRECGKEYR